MQLRPEHKRFDACAEEYIKGRAAGWRNDKNRRQLENITRVRERIERASHWLRHRYGSLQKRCARRAPRLDGGLGHMVYWRQILTINGRMHFPYLHRKMT